MIVCLIIIYLHRAITDKAVTHKSDRTAACLLNQIPNCMHLADITSSIITYFSQLLRNSEMDDNDDEKYVSSKFQMHSEKIQRYITEHDDVVYAHQVEAVMEAKTYFEKYPNGVALIVLPTGCGKTGVAVLSAYVLKAKSVLVVTPSLTVTEEIGENFSHHEKSFLVKRGIIKKKNAKKYLPSTATIKNAKEIITSFNCDLMIVNAHKVRNKRPAVVTIEDIPNDMYDLIIVDEAHHYPAETWRLLVNHFTGSKRLFLTATPFYKGKHLSFIPNPKRIDEEIPLPICYALDRSDAIASGIIRRTEFFELPAQPGDEDEMIFENIAGEIKKHLQLHDELDPQGVPHQAMVLAQSIKTINPAEGFAAVYNSVNSNAEDRCEVYVSGKKYKHVEDKFNNHKLRTIVICGKLIEGYDNSNVSVVAIVRNVTSKVLFTQFLGRAIRKNRDVRSQDQADPIRAAVISHGHYKQRKNYDSFDKIAEEDPEDDNEEQ